MIQIEVTGRMSRKKNAAGFEDGVANEKQQ